MLEHRRSKRVAIDKVVRLIVAGQRCIKGRMRNVNHYGMYIESSVILPKNTCVAIDIDFTGEQVFPNYGLPAMVVHRCHAGMGLVLDASDPQTVAALNRLVQEALDTETLFVSARPNQDSPSDSPVHILASAAVKPVAA